MSHFDLASIQSSIREQHADGWLLCDFRGSNELARRILHLPGDSFGSRRWFYFVPANGEPTKIVHRIESGMLDSLPGKKSVYLAWQTLHEFIRTAIHATGRDRPRIAMEYSPHNAIPYVSKVDAGSVDLVRSFGAEVVSSADLIQLYEATWTDEQWKLHLQAETVTTATYGLVWDFIREKFREGTPLRETDVQQFIMDHFARNWLVTNHPPIVAVNANASDPHYAPTIHADAPILRGDLVLVDLWAKVDHPDGVYSDLTRMGFVGDTVPTPMAKVFSIVSSARDAGIELVEERMRQGLELRGWEVDRAVRDVIEKAGFGEYFIHRTGHSIGRETHGAGANMDGLETQDDRKILPRTCFSIEPGIYLAEFGVRSEINVFVDHDRAVHVTGGPVQQEIHAILS